MKNVILALLTIFVFSALSLADDETEFYDRFHRRHGFVQCVARDPYGDTFDGYDLHERIARREAIQNCWEHQPSRSRLHGGCYVVYCTRL